MVRLTIRKMGFVIFLSCTFAPPFANAQKSPVSLYESWSVLIVAIFISWHLYRNHKPPVWLVSHETWITQSSHIHEAALVQQSSSTVVYHIIKNHPGLNVNKSHTNYTMKLSRKLLHQPIQSQDRLLVIGRNFYWNSEANCLYILLNSDWQKVLLKEKANYLYIALLSV